MKLVVLAWLFSRIFQLNDMFKLSVVRRFSAPTVTQRSTCFGQWNSRYTDPCFVSKRLDYCNCLLSGTSKVVTDVLQNLENAAARLLLGYSHTGCVSLTGSTISDFYSRTRIYMVRRRIIYKNCAFRHKATYIERAWHQHIVVTWFPSCKPDEIRSTIVCLRRTTYMELIASATQGFQSFAKRVQKKTKDACLTMSSL